MPSDIAIAPLPGINANIGRVVLELTGDNTIVMEHYTNGQRQRTTLQPGDAWWTVVDELRAQQRHAVSAAERKAQTDETKLRQRHNRVWAETAATHGIGFAKNVIKGSVPPGYGQYFAKDIPASKSQPANGVMSSTDLL